MGELKKTVVHWFRKDLRIHDNPALNDAIKSVRENSEFVLRPIYLLDPEMNDFVRMGANRTRFFQESLAQLDEGLRSMGSRQVNKIAENIIAEIYWVLSFQIIRDSWHTKK